MITDEYFNKILEEANNLYPKWFNSNSPKQSKNNGKERDLNFLSYLFTNGVPYQYLKDKLNVLGQPRLAKSHIDFIYSRDEVLFIPGQWYKFDFIDLVLMKKYYDENYVSKVSNKKIDNDKRIGLLFAIYIKYKNQIKKEKDFVNKNSHKISYDVLAQMQSGNYVFFGKPLDLSRFAGIISTEAVRNSNRLEGWIEELGFKKIHFNSANKRIHLIIYGIEKFINGFDQYKNHFVRRIDAIGSDPIIKNVLDNFIDKPLPKLPKDIKDLLIEFEFRFHRKASFFNLKKFRTLPFIRIMYSNYIWRYKFYVPAVFINYTHLTNILFYKYCFNQNINDYFDFANGKKTTDGEIQKSFDWLRNTLHNLNLDKELDYEDNSSFMNSKHFKQIRESYPIVKRISENGINLNIEKVKEYLNKQLANYKADKNSITDQKLSKLFEEIDSYLNNNSVDDSLIEKFFEKENEPSNDELNNKNKRHIVKTIYREYDYNLIKYLFLGLIFASFNSDCKIYGHFTTHGANTHRMTSKKFNLQGIPKEMRENYFLPSKSENGNVRRLYSADVSGQDLAVAISLARRYYSSIENNKKVEKCDEIINEFIRANTTEKNDELNITYQGITDWLTYESIMKLKTKVGGELIKTSYILVSLRNPFIFKNEMKNFKNVIKKFIYTKLYGGNKRTVINDISNTFDSMKNDLNKMIDELNSQENNSNEPKPRYKALQQIQQIFNQIKKIDPREIVKTIDNSLKQLNDTSKPEFINNQPMNNQLEDIIIKLVHYFTDDYFKHCILTFLFLNILNKEIFQKKLKVLNEFLKDAQEYYETNNKTLPTLLNWQTVLEDIDISDKKIKTRSRSYPIQASGAELMRQWLIELDKYSKKYDFKIVNTIHDQVILDAPGQKEKEIQKKLESSIEKAAKKLGIDPKLIRLDFKEFNL